MFECVSFDEVVHKNSGASVQFSAHLLISTTLAKLEGGHGNCELLLVDHMVSGISMRTLTEICNKFSATTTTIACVKRICRRRMRLLR